MFSDSQLNEMPKTGRSVELKLEPRMHERGCKLIRIIVVYYCGQPRIIIINNKAAVT